MKKLFLPLLMLAFVVSSTAPALAAEKKEGWDDDEVHTGPAGTTVLPDDNPEICVANAAQLAGLVSEHTVKKYQINVKGEVLTAAGINTDDISRRQLKVLLSESGDVDDNGRPFCEVAKRGKVVFFATTPPALADSLPDGGDRTGMRRLFSLIADYLNV